MSFAVSRRRVLTLGAATLALGGIGRLLAMGRDPVEDPDSLRAIARGRGIRFGTAVSHLTLGDGEACALILRECDVVTPENQFKWRFFEPTRNRYDFAPAREVVAFAKNNDLELRGHCFVWDDDRSTPQWLLNREDKLSRENGEELLERMDHFAHQLHRRAPAVASWDVVNESIEPESGVMRDTVF